MNNNKESDKTYLVTSLTKDTNNEIEAFDTEYTMFHSLKDAEKHYKQLINCSNIYSANIAQVIQPTDYHQTRAAKIVDKPKKITNDFDYWITELDKTEQNITDWLSYCTENFEEEPNINKARTTIQEAVQLIQKNKEKYVSEIPTANCVTAVLDYILYSEMGGTYDATDSWHSTYQLLMELRNDKIDPDDLSYVSNLEPLH